MPRPLEAVEAELEAASHLRALGRQRGEDRPLAGTIDSLLDEWLDAFVASALDTTSAPLKENA